MARDLFIQNIFKNSRLLTKPNKDQFSYRSVNLKKYCFFSFFPLCFSFSVVIF